MLSVLDQSSREGERVEMSRLLGKVISRLFIKIAGWETCVAVGAKRYGVNLKAKDIRLVEDHNLSWLSNV